MPLKQENRQSANEHKEEMFPERVATSENYAALVAPLVSARNDTLPTHHLFGRYIEFSTGKVRYVDTVERTRAELSDYEFHRLPFYQKAAKPLGIVDQLVFHIYVAHARGIIVTLHFDRLFSRNELLITSILRGHLVARLYAIQRQKSRRAKAAIEIRSELAELLTPRVLGGVQLISQNFRNPEIADKHASNILAQLRLSSRIQTISQFGQWLT